MTEQSTYRRRIGRDEQIALMLMCVRCNRFRTFKIHKNLQLLTEKGWSTIRVSSICVRCGFIMDIRLGWHKAGVDYSSEEVSLEGEVATVSDEVPLAREANESDN